MDLPDDSHEILRTTHVEELDATSDVLSAAGIECRIVSTVGEQDGLEAAFMGRATGSEPLALVVAKADAEAAQAALERAYGDSELPENHFLGTATDAELTEVVLNPGAWSPFDVVQAI
jgi:hypothetical protein